MSMSTHVTGFAPPDEQWQKMKAIWDACGAAQIPVPGEVEEFFGGEAPDPAGVEVDLPLREWQEDGASAGYELDVAAIPPQVKTIRFYNSW
jgi:hypothetical protein